MRIRSIKPDFWTSEQIISCSPNARLTFVGIWNLSDDYGVYPSSAFRIKLQLYPAGCFTIDEVRSHIEELIRAGLLEEYIINNSTFLHSTGWEKHQKIDQKTGLYPLPSGEIGKKIRRMSTEQSENIQDMSTEHSCKEKEKEKENNKKENIKEKSLAALSSEPMSASIPDKKQKHQYGEFKNVLLTDDELSNLKIKFPSTWNDWIDKLSYHIGSKGDKYKSHYKTILNWHKMELERNGKTTTTSQSPSTYKGNVI